MTAAMRGFVGRQPVGRSLQNSFSALAAVKSSIELVIMIRALSVERASWEPWRPDSQKARSHILVCPVAEVAAVSTAAEDHGDHGSRDGVPTVNV
ncbi:hypothetical protein [Streptomyces purpurogeneiscleroticus]|uniref:hypothetical protein n=1 Tax=Streptomyces purpurogeneiscleroticus TaxID=68259 RepID=UPI001CC0ECF4|nr:hypothetical protein [Streptomyces purpurogeneiscleroticus]